MFYCSAYSSATGKVDLTPRNDGTDVESVGGRGGRAHDSLGVPDRRIPTGHGHGYSAFFGEEKATTGILAIQEVE